MSYEARWTFGVWLRRRYTETVRRLSEATAVVGSCGVSERELGMQWDAQVQAQLKKVPREWSRWIISRHVLMHTSASRTVRPRRR